MCVVEAEDKEVVADEEVGVGVRIERIGAGLFQTGGRSSVDEVTEEMSQEDKASLKVT